LITNCAKTGDNTSKSEKVKSRDQQGSNT